MEEIRMDAALAWSRKVFGSADLGDVRRTRRLVEVGAVQVQNPSGTIYENTAGNPALREAAYRLSGNSEIDPEAIAEGGFDGMAESCAGRVVLLAEDTTSMGFDHSVRHQLGELGAAGQHRKGYWIHSAIGIDAETGGVLGLFGMKRWIRDGDDSKPPESSKWGDVDKPAVERILDAGAKRVITVSDRESAIYAHLLDKTVGPPSEAYVIRGKKNRRVKTGDGGEAKLLPHLKQLRPIGERTVFITQRGRPDSRSKKRKGRKGRTATLELRATEIEMCCPTDVPEDEQTTITLNAVLVTEKRPPADRKPIQWILLTNEPIETFEQVDFIVDCYERRWLIEEFHRAWKTGCKAEDSLMREQDNLARWITILAFVAIRVLQLRQAHESMPDAPCTKCWSRRSCVPGDLGFVYQHRDRDRAGMTVLCTTVRWRSQLRIDTTRPP